MTKKTTSRLGRARAVCLPVALCALGSSLADEPAMQISVKDVDAKASLGSYSASATVTVPSGARVKLRASVPSGQRLDRVRFATPSTNPECRLANGKAALHDTEAPFVAVAAAGKDCRWKAFGYDDAAGTSTKLVLRIVWDDDGSGGSEGGTGGAPEGARRFDFTQGTDEYRHLQLGAMDTRQKHGVRVFCVVSHYSYDDPIVHPGKPDAAHLHMFLGNTSTDAYSTGRSLKVANSSSCEGGTSAQSAYWMPALFDAKDRVVVPERFVTYYKTFLPGPRRDRLPEGLVRPIPDGLEMLAGPGTLNYDANPGAYTKVRNSGGQVQLTVVFPQCVAVDGRGAPVLSHREMAGAKATQLNSHLAYAVYASGNPTGCPASHPYRVPGVFYNVWYDVDPDSRWYLASDTDRSRPGHSLHADYVAAWDQSDMAKIVRCNLEARSCGFGEARQLPERLHDADGNRVYRNSVTLMPGQTRTPFGKLPKMRGEMAGH